jgi:chromosome segregation ATPase
LRDSGVKETGLRDSGNVVEPISEKIELKHQVSLPEIKTIQSDPKPSQPNLETLMKLETQSKQLKKLQKENEKLQREIERLQKDVEKKNEVENKMKTDIDELNNKILNFDEEKSKLLEQINKLNFSVEKLNEEKAFYIKVK